MTITLPPPIQQWVEAQAGRTGTTAEEYVVQLLRDRMNRNDPATADELLRETLAEGDPDQVPALRRGIETKVQEALASGPAVEVSEAFWAERRRELAKRLASQGRNGP